MDPITQEAAVAPERLADGDRCRFWRSPRLGGLEALHARFVAHRYPRHTHETYVMGVVTHGVEAFWCRGGQHRAGPGHACFVNPGEVHDGEPVAPGYVYRMIYPSTELVRDVAAEIGLAGPLPQFGATVVADAALADAFAALHRRLGEAGAALAQDEALLATIGTALRRHARAPVPAPRAAVEPRAVARARELIETAFDSDLDLATLAAAGGVSRCHLVRAFRRATGTTPHGWLIDRRVRAACRRLRRGEAPAAVAHSCGFADQAHLTRAFKARMGVTPGAYRRAALA